MVETSRILVFYKGFSSISQQNDHILCHRHAFPTLKTPSPFWINMEVSARSFSLSSPWSYCQPLGRFLFQLHVWEGRTSPVLRGSPCPSAAIAETFGPLSPPFYVLSSLSAQTMGLLRMDVFPCHGLQREVWASLGNLWLSSHPPDPALSRPLCLLSLQLPCWSASASRTCLLDSEMMPVLSALEPQPWQPHQPHPSSTLRLLSSTCPKVSVWTNALMSPVLSTLGLGGHHLGTSSNLFLLTATIFRWLWTTYFGTQGTLSPTHTLACTRTHTHTPARMLAHTTRYHFTH